MLNIQDTLDGSYALILKLILILILILISISMDFGKKHKSGKHRSRVILIYLYLCLDESFSNLFHPYCVAGKLTQHMDFRILCRSIGIVSSGIQC